MEGTVYDGGSACQFRLCYQTVEGTPIVVTGASAFALCGVEIPCQVGGISPTLQMDFDACASILNPTLTAGSDGSITLTGSLVVTPQLHLRVTRESLFDLNAKEIGLPCDDVGQCSACNPTERACLGDASNCCCGQTTPNRVNELLDYVTDNNNSECRCSGNTAVACTNSSVRSVSESITCQCCDTNGYSF